MLFFDVTRNKKTKSTLTTANQKDELLRQQIACYEIAKKTYNFVMTYVRNRTINMTLVMLFLIGNKFIYLLVCLLTHLLIYLLTYLLNPHIPPPPLARAHTHSERIKYILIGC